MATKAKGGFLLPLLLVGGAVAYFGVDEVEDAVRGALIGEPVVIGVGDEAVMVADDAASMVRKCTTTRVLRQKRCGEVKVVIMDAARMPHITRNISPAWSEGKEHVLTRSGVSRHANYKAACGGFVKKHVDGSCDEYAFASTVQGGIGARTEEVPAREQDCQGGTPAAAYRWQGIRAGDDFLVVISNPHRVAVEPYRGRDIAEDQSTCGS
ncbi:hypothetical protein C1701_15875 [Actinoalloteichus sp. AHMU CJ021]|uniref:NucA/NucB deoxyribonuclease domain-containing protein n=1 Tax=Actinoalloteichus sp. AHMU CJ021 TaxID=2072503 RepID=UPI000CA04B62|nr:hypothetical protein C1701_15875 [Actinoalloteichus sp. AHMU CJ021]